MNINLLHLYYFYMVARHGSVTAASLILKVQQPALSIMLKKFETQLGFPVFEKKGRKLSLTEKGKGLYSYAEEVFSKVQLLEDFIGLKTNETSGKLRVATNDLIAHYLLSPIISKWITNYPLVEITILITTAQEACEKMIRDEVDMGLYFYGPEEMSGIEIEKIKKIPFSCVGLKKQPDFFIGSREVDYSLTRKFPTFEKLKKINPKIKIAMNTNSLMLHKEMALKGVGAVILPEFSIKSHLNSKKLVNLLPNEKLEYSMKLYQRKNKILSTTMELFLENVLSQLSKLEK